MRAKTPKKKHAVQYRRSQGPQAVSWWGVSKVSKRGFRAAGGICCRPVPVNNSVVGPAFIPVAGGNWLLFPSWGRLVMAAEKCSRPSAGEKKITLGEFFVLGGAPVRVRARGPKSLGGGGRPAGNTCDDEGTKKGTTEKHATALDHHRVREKSTQNRRTNKTRNEKVTLFRTRMEPEHGGAQKQKKPD